MLSRMLFETRMGNAMLAILERRANLAIVEAQALGATRIPMAADDNHRESDRSPKATIIHNYTTGNGTLTSEANRLRGLLLALDLYPRQDTREGNLDGLLNVLVGMIKHLDSNDIVCLFTITTQLYGSVPPDDFWQEHQAKWVEIA